jgi:cytochrome c oxidase assembly protein subunit 11
VNLKKKNFVFGVSIAAVVLLMFTFAYANVPLFKLFCQHFGLGGQGKAGIETAVIPSSSTEPVTTRFITVHFMGTSASGLPVRFRPSIPMVSTNPGRPVHLEYTFVNMSDDSVYFRAVHSISPLEAAKEFQLIKCFCFEDQVLGPRETRKLPVYFALTPRIPYDVHEVTLSYQLFPRDPHVAMPVPAKEVN